MYNPQFTSGPWHVSKNQPTVVGTREKAVCKCELDWDLGARERKANAALIAAAPEMYALLLDIVTDYQCMPNPAVMADKIEAVLKKARGEQ